MKPETATYLKAIRPNGPWFLTALNPDFVKGEYPATICSSDPKAIKAFVDQWNGKRNLYCRPNVTQGTGKAADTNDRIEWLFTDLDPYKPGAEGIEEVRQRLRDYTYPPTMEVLTGGGVQAYWRLDVPISYQDAAEINRHHVELFAADEKVWTPEFNMRLPGTTNLPNEKKRTQFGREPSEATLGDIGTWEVYEDYIFPHGKLPEKAEHKVELGDVVFTKDLGTLSIPDSLRYLIQHGQDEQDSLNGDRSDYVFRATCDLIRARVPNEVIAGILLDPTYHISDSVVEKGEGQAERAAHRAIEHAFESGARPRATAEEDFDAPSDGSTEHAIEAQMAKAEEVKAKKEDAFAAAVERFRPRQVADGLKKPRPKWLIKGWMLQGSLNALVGGEKTFKTFTMLDVSSRIALGLAWHGLPMTKGRVLYIIGEGNEREFVDRILAWCIKYGYDPEELRDKLVYIPLRVGLDNADDMKAFMVAAASDGYALVVVDTLARNMDGAENDTRDMNLFVRGADAIREKFRCAVMIVHHTGKDPTKIYRGNSALVGAVDSMWLTLREGDSEELVLELYRSRMSKQGIKRIFKAETIQTVEMGPEDEPSETLAMTFVREGNREDGKAKNTEPSTNWERVLVAVAEMPGATASTQDAIVAGLGMNKGSVSRSIKALRDKEFLTGTGPFSLTEVGVIRAVELGAALRNRAEQDFDGE